MTNSLLCVVFFGDHVQDKSLSLYSICVWHLVTLSNMCVTILAKTKVCDFIQYVCVAKTKAYDFIQYVCDNLSQDKSLWLYLICVCQS